MASVHTFDTLIARGILEIGDGYRAKNSELDGDGPLFLRAGNMTDNGIDWSGSERFQKASVPGLRSKMGRPDDTVVTTKGNSVGRAGYIPVGAPEFVYSPHLSYWRSLNREELDPGYLRYWSRGPEFRHQLAALAHGTDMAPYLSLRDQRAMRISLPSIGQQRAVGVVLTAVDDKIAINEQIGLVVDALCAALFDDLLSRDDAVTRVRLDSIADVNRRSVKPQADGYLRYVDISSVGVGRLSFPQRIPSASAPGRARRCIEPGDTVWSMVRPNRRSHALILDDDPELIASTGLAVISPRETDFSYLYEVTRREEFVSHLESLAEGSAYPAVRPEHFGSASVPILSKPYRAEFEDTASALRRRAHLAARESLTLVVLRDTLLPKLMSGDFRVRDAEQIVGDAV